LVSHISRTAHSKCGIFHCKCCAGGESAVQSQDEDGMSDGSSIATVASEQGHDEAASEGCSS